MFFSQKVSLPLKDVDTPNELTSVSDENNIIDEVSPTSLFQVGLTRARAEEVAGELLSLFNKYNSNGDDEIQQNEFDVFTRENNTEEFVNTDDEIVEDYDEIISDDEEIISDDEEIISDDEDILGDEVNEPSLNETLNQSVQEDTLKNDVNLRLRSHLNSNKANVRVDKSALIEYLGNYSHLGDTNFNFGGKDDISDINELAKYLGISMEALKGDDKQKFNLIKDCLMAQMNNDFNVQDDNSLYSVALNKIKNGQLDIEYLSSQDDLSDEELAVKYVKTVYSQKMLSIGLFEKKMSGLTSYDNSFLSDFSNELNNNLVSINEDLKGDTANQSINSFVEGVSADKKYSRAESISDILRDDSVSTEDLSIEQKVELFVKQENEQFTKELLQTKEGGVYYNQAKADIESNYFVDDMERKYYNGLSGDKNSKYEQLAQFRLYRKTTSNFNAYLQNLKKNNYDEYKALIKSIDKFDYSKVDMMKLLFVVDASETSKSQKDSEEFSRQALGYVKEKGNTNLDSVNKIVYNNLVQKVSKDELKELAGLSSENAYYIKMSAQNLIDSGKISSDKIRDLNEVIKIATKVISDSNYVHDERKVGMSNSNVKTFGQSGLENNSKTTISASGTISTHHLLDMLQSKDIELMELPSVISTMVANSTVKLSTNQYDIASLKKIVETFININNLTKEQFKNMDEVLNCINSLPDDLKYDLKSKINLFLTGANPKTLCGMYVKGSNDTRTYLKEEKFITPVILYNYFLKNPSEKVTAPKEIIFEIEEFQKQIQKKY